MTARSDRWWWALAVLASVVGAVVNLWRPLAPRLSSSPVVLERFDPEVLAAVQQYRQPRLWVALVEFLLVAALPAVLVLAPRPRAWLLRLADRRQGVGPPTALRDGVNGALVAVTMVGAVLLACLPLDWWVGHRQESQWGFRTAGLLGWLRDWLVGAAVELLVVAVAAAAFVLLVRRWPRQWPPRMVLAATVLAGALVLLQPLVVQPLLLATRPLEPGPLRERLQQVSAAAGIDAEVAVGDASRRTTKVNAFVTGLGPTRRVVLWDNLLARPDDEVVAVVAHELAHRAHRDLARGVLLTSTGVLPFALVLRRLHGSRWVGRHIDVRRGGDPRAVALLVAAAAVAQAVALPAGLWFSRRAEAAADHRALELTSDPAPLVATFRGFVVRDLSWPDPPGLAVLLFGTHPSVDRRIRAVVDDARRRGLEVPSLEDVEASEADQRHRRIR